MVDVLADPSCRIPVAPTAEPGDDIVEVRGLRASRPRLEGALGACPGVATAAVAMSTDGDPRLVVSVTPDDDAVPTLSALRQALWASRPGALWPAEGVVSGTDEAIPAGSLPMASILAVLWAESSGKPVGPDTSYWQDSSFLPVLVAAREAGLAVGDDDVVRCRTPATLAAAMAARG